MSGLAGMYDLRDENQVKEYLDKLGIEYRFQCYHEKLPEGCHRLAAYLEAFKSDMEKANTVFKMNCYENKYGHSCFKYGNYSLAGLGGEKDVKKADDAFVKSCELGYGPGCHNAALLSTSGELNGKKDFVRARDYYEKGCKQRNPPSCHQLSMLHITGKEGVPKDMAEAFKYAKIACDQGHFNACVNLSIMYKKGDGVAKNLELFEKYKKRAIDLRDDVIKPKQEIKFSE